MYATPKASPIAGTKQFSTLAKGKQAVAFRRSQRVQVTTCGYKFGDFSRGAAKRAKENIEKMGRKLTGDESYQIGDLSKGLVADIRESAASYEFGDISKAMLKKVSESKFGQMADSVWNADWGQKFLDSATAAGRKITGREDYKFGDLARELQDNLVGIKDRADRLRALPAEVDRLQQIAKEQQLLINSLTETIATEQSLASLDEVIDSADAEALAPVVLEQQEAIDVLLREAASEDEG